MPILAILYTARGRCYSHSIHKVTKEGPQCTKGVGTLVPKMQGDGFTSELGGIMEVVTWLCTLLLVGL